MKAITQTVQSLKVLVREIKKKEKEMKLEITKAVRQKRKARIMLAGPSGAGKTFSALRLARGLVGDQGGILLLDTERGSATLYADVTDFDHADLPDYRYETFIDAIREGERHGYDVIVIDSLSHAWEEFLEQHNKMQGNSFVNWGKITPKYNQLINAITSCKAHVICTGRAKTKYEMDEKNRPTRQYTDTILRPGSEYEFDILGMIDIHHNLHVEKTRLQFLADQIISKPSEELGRKIAEWLNSGAEPLTKKPQAVDQKPASITGTREAVEAMINVYDLELAASKMKPAEKAKVMAEIRDKAGLISADKKRAGCMEPIDLLEDFRIHGAHIDDDDLPTFTDQKLEALDNATA